MISRITYLLCLCLCFTLASSAFSSEPYTAALQNDLIDVWLGTGNGKVSKGIYHCTLNTVSGKLSDPTVVAEMSGPGFLAMHPKLPVMYAVGGINGEASVAAFSIEGTLRKAALKFMNSLPIGDGGAAHVSVDKTGHTLLTAQYGGGSTGVFSLNTDGSLKARTQLIEHEGGSRAVPGRQDSSHAHWTGFSPDNQYAFVPDLGLDKVVIYKADALNSDLQPHGFGQVAAGGGPRHMKFHNNGKWIYVLHELDLKVTLFDYDSANGTMSARQTIETVPAAELKKEQFKSCSEIRVHPNGRFVYAANRGHDTVTAFSVDQQTGELTLIERENVRGATPRNFSIDPTGKWLLAAGQDSHTLACFAIDQQTGELTYNRSVVFAPACICVLFGHE